MLLCRRDVAASTAGDPSRDPIDGRRAREICSLARAHGVAGIVTSRLREPSVARGIDDATLVDLAEIESGLRRRGSLLAIVRNNVVRRLGSAGVRSILLKGAAMVACGYLSASERDQVDVDILVDERMVEAAVEILMADGFRPHESERRIRDYRTYHFHVPMYGPGGLAVEIHWALGRAGSGFDLDAGAVSASAGPCGAVPEETVLVPRPEHLLLHFVLQHVQEGFARLGRIVDIDRIVSGDPHLDWNVVVRDARPGNLSSATWVSLRLARALMGTQIPESVIASLQPGGLTCKHLQIIGSPEALLTGHGARDYATRQLQRFWLLRDVRGRARVVRDTLFIGHDGVNPDAGRRGFLRNSLSLVRAIGVQASLYVKALANAAWLRHRPQIRF